MMKRHSGNTLIGLIIGLVIGLGIALGVAVYVTKVPVPFMTKTQRGGAEQDEAEARKNRDWDPNAPLAGKNAARNNPSPSAAPPAATASPSPAAPAAPVVVPPAVAAARPAASAAAAARTPRTVRPAEAAGSDPLGDLARARAGDGGSAGTVVATAPATTGPGGDPFMYFVQAGAFRTNEDAESQRAKLSLMGVQARVTEREQSGRTVFRVRAGPFDQKDEADRLKERLDGSGLESALVRVQR
ncbi:MAG: sporulation protein [Comamonadaceae bacterium]|nr:MAG: sporulation protein [Comamonadaceae bacterium]